MPVDEVKAGHARHRHHASSRARRGPNSRSRSSASLPNAVGPRRHLILARLSGQRLADTGVMQGMSGSPVYIDGRLVGAVSVLAGRVLEGADRRHHADRRHDRRHRPHHRHAGAGAERGRGPALAGRRRRSSRRPCATPSRGSPARARRSRWPASTAPVLAALPDHSQLRPIVASPTRWPASPATRPRRSPARSARRSRRGTPAQAPIAAGTAVDRGAGARRRGRRQPDPRRPDLRRHRHGHPRRRRARLRVRPSVLQPRPDRVPDDAGLRPDAAAEPERLAEAGRHRRRRRHDAAGSLDGHRRHARRRPGAGPGEADAAVRSRRRRGPSRSRSSRTSCSRRS